jgi:hypothetical protein
VTVVDERPRNGHVVEHTMPAQPLDVETELQGQAAVAEPEVGESDDVQKLRQRVANKRTKRDLLHQYAEISEDPVFDEVRSEDEETADRTVAEDVRAKQRKERKRSGIADVRRARRNRRWDWWDERATRARDRILDPARAIGSDYRKLVASSWAAFVLIAGGVAFMAKNVHDGLVGVDGTWTGYLVEPLASVLLAISMAAQFTARKRGITIRRSFYCFDGLLLLASVLLNVIPSGVRFGWLAGDFIAHVLVPSLVVAAVFAWHLASNLYGQAIAQSKDAPIVIFRDDQTTAEHLALLHKANRNGQVPANPSVSQLIKCLRTQLPNGIGHAAARRIAAIYLGGR